ncbi:hypothetical protein [Streptomyces hokutonensis]|uniref:hypothetical protein n=1 Tax=Streptomyces hokutonensis TaxID=1306990 RepID=UPI00039A6BD1|nr:hypothetical protein [Streptomyces hokutonensis]
MQRLVVGDVEDADVGVLADAPPDVQQSFPAGVLRDTVLGYLAIMRGRPAEADTYLTQAWEHCDPDRHPELMAKICQRRVLHALGRWDGRDLVDWARRAIDFAADPDDPSAIESEAVLGLGLAAMGRPEEALAAYEAAASKTPGGAQPQRFQLGRGWVDLALDAPEAARPRLEAAVPTSFRMGSTRIFLWAEGWLARTQFTLGSWSEALETVQRAALRPAEVRIELVRPLCTGPAPRSTPCAATGTWPTGRWPKPPRASTTTRSCSSRPASPAPRSPRRAVTTSVSWRRWPPWSSSANGTASTNPASGPGPTCTPTPLW